MNSSPSSFLKKWLFGLGMVLGVALLLGLCVLDDGPMDGSAPVPAVTVTQSVLLGEGMNVQQPVREGGAAAQGGGGGNKQMDGPEAEVRLARFFEIVVLPMGVFVIVCTVVRANMARR